MGSTCATTHGAVGRGDAHDPTRAIACMTIYLVPTPTAPGGGGGSAKPVLAVMAYDWHGRGQPDNLFECSHSDSVDRIQVGASRACSTSMGTAERSGLELPKRGGSAQEASEVGGRLQIVKERWIWT